MSDFRHEPRFPPHFPMPLSETEEMVLRDLLAKVVEPVQAVFATYPNDAQGEQILCMHHQYKWSQPKYYAAKKIHYLCAERVGDVITVSAVYGKKPATTKEACTILRPIRRRLALQKAILKAAIMRRVARNSIALLQTYIDQATAIETQAKQMLDNGIDEEAYKRLESLYLQTHNMRIPGDTDEYGTRGGLPVVDAGLWPVHFD